MKQDDPEKFDRFGFSKLTMVEAGEELIRLDALLADLDTQAKQALEKYNELRIYVLPQRMQDEGVSQFGIGNQRIERKSAIAASLPKNDPVKRRKIFDLLLKLNQGGVIARVLSLALPKGDAVAEHKALEALRETLPGMIPQVEETIHHMTYTALAKRLIESGTADPDDLNAVVVQQVKIVGVDKKKKRT